MMLQNGNVYHTNVREMCLGFLLCKRKEHYCPWSWNLYECIDLNGSLYKLLTSKTIFCTRDLDCHVSRDCNDFKVHFSSCCIVFNQGYSFMNVQYT